MLDARTAGGYRFGRPRWLVAGSVAALLAVPFLPAGAARADTVPVAPTTVSTVASDALPTVQINGVVWSQVIVGNTVYATGKFTSARPAGAALGTNETPRSNILAYDIRTGAMITSWAPTLNAQGLAITASADGTKIFVGGDFTSVSGVTKNRIVALDASTGAVLTAFAASANGTVRALTVAGDVLYAGGSFSTTGGVARSRLAAFSATNGSLLSWAPAANAPVLALTAPANNGKVVVGGRFTTLNGVANYGMGALDATTGANLSWPVNTIVRNAGDATAINSLINDGTTVYGTGYTFGSGGNLENSFATDLNGNLTWVVGCLGDTYSGVPLNGVFYAVGHAHNCSQIGDFPQENPWTYQRALAFTATTGAHGETNLSGNFTGRPAPEKLVWSPTLDAGTYTGQTQAAWHVTGNAQYVVLGGEFPRVNYTGQQGLVRFAVKDLSTNKQGPTTPGDLTPTVTQVSTGALRVSWKATWDRDNERLTYEVLRNGAVVGTLKADSAWWDRPTLSYTDTTATPGASVTYQIRVKDATNTITGTTTATATGPSPARVASAYANAVRTDGASDYWRLGEASGATAYDWSSARDLTLSSYTRGTAGAITGDADTATTFSGGLFGVPGTTKLARYAPQHYSAEAWFKTTSTQGGKIIGFGNSSTGDSSTADRHVYMSNDGTLTYGILQNGAAKTVTSGSAYNDGQWHHVVSTLSDSGMQLSVDGASVGSRTDTTFGQLYSGYWRVGGDAISALFPNRPTRTRLAGAIDEVAIYSVALDGAKVGQHAALGKATNQPPTAAFTSTVNNLVVTFNASGSTDADGTVASYAWTFGDGATGTGATPSHTYAAAGTYPVTLTVTDNAGATGTVTQQVTAAANQSPTASFTSSASGPTATFNGSGSTDPDGTVASYAWTFGDGGIGTGATPSHTYAAAGTYPVTLTVTDDDGATGTSTADVTVTATAPGTPFAQDAFSRTVTSGWGTADQGGAWSGGSTTASVADGSGRMSVAKGGTTTMRLPNAQALDSDVQELAWLEAMPTGGGAYLSTIARGTATGDYRAKVRIQSTGVVQLSLTKVVGGTETEIAAATTVSGLTYTAGTKLRIRVQTVGASPTTVQAKVWADGAAEPGTWQRTATDSTDGLQVAGGLGQVTYVSSSATATLVVRYDNFVGSQP